MLCDKCACEIADTLWDGEERRITDGSFTARFSRAEGILLDILFERLGKLVPMYMIVEALWNDAEEDRLRDPERQVHTMKCKIMRKLRGSRINIRTVRSKGYLLELKDDSCSSGLRRTGPHDRDGTRPDDADGRGVLSAGH